MTILIMYFIASILWGAFAVRMQNKLYGGSLLKLLYVFGMNAAIWPICMIIAIIFCRTEREKNV